LHSEFIAKKMNIHQFSDKEQTINHFSFFLISITGGSASGKSSVLNEIRALFDKKVCIISQDDYYKSIEFQTKDEKGIYNFDLPEAIDHVQFLDDLYKISTGKTIEKYEYTFNHPDKKAALKTFYPASVVIIEGLFVLYHPELAAKVDCKVFVDAEENICFERRKKRDIFERGIPENVFLHQWNHHVLPAYHSFVVNYKSQCDLIINNNINFREGLDQLCLIISEKTVNNEL